MSTAEIKIQESKLMRLYFGQDFLPCHIRTEYDLSCIPKERLFTLILPFQELTDARNHDCTF